MITQQSISASHVKTLSRRVTPLKRIDDVVRWIVQLPGCHLRTAMKPKSTRVSSVRSTCTSLRQSQPCVVWTRPIHPISRSCRVLFRSIRSPVIELGRRRRGALRHPFFAAVIAVHEQHLRRAIDRDNRHETAAKPGC